MVSFIVVAPEMEISPTDVLEASEMLATRRVMSVPFGSESGL